MALDETGRLGARSRLAATGAAAQGQPRTSPPKAPTRSRRSARAISRWAAPARPRRMTPTRCSTTRPGSRDRPRDGDSAPASSTPTLRPYTFIGAAVPLHLSDDLGFDVTLGVARYNRVHARSQGAFAATEPESVFLRYLLPGISGDFDGEIDFEDAGEPVCRGRAARGDPGAERRALMSTGSTARPRPAACMRARTGSRAGRSMRRR